GSHRRPVGIRELMHFAAPFAPIYRTGASLRSATHRTHMDGIHEETPEIKAFNLAQMIQEDVMDVTPDTRKIPIPQPAPTSHATATAHLLREILPGDARFQNKNDARQRFAIIQRWPPTFGPRRMFGKSWLDDLPKTVRQEWLCHVKSLQQDGRAEVLSHCD